MNDAPVSSVNLRVRGFVYRQPWRDCIKATDIHQDSCFHRLAAHLNEKTPRDNETLPEHWCWPCWTAFRLEKVGAMLNAYVIQQGKLALGEPLKREQVSAEETIIKSTEYISYGMILPPVEP